MSGKAISELASVVRLREQGSKPPPPRRRCRTATRSCTVRLTPSHPPAGRLDQFIATKDFSILQSGPPIEFARREPLP